jgi:hypothetical protein
MIANPHPDAGKMNSLNDVGATYGCLPCAEKRANGRRRMLEQLRQWIDARRDESMELNEVARVLTLDDVSVQIGELEKRRRREFRESASR